MEHRSPSFPIASTHGAGADIVFTQGLFPNGGHQPMNWTALRRISQTEELTQLSQGLRMECQISASNPQASALAGLDLLQGPSCHPVSPRLLSLTFGTNPECVTFSSIHLRMKPGWYHLSEEGPSTPCLADAMVRQHPSSASNYITLGRSNGFSEAGYSSEHGGSSLGERVHTAVSFHASSASQDINTARSHGPLSLSPIQTLFNPSAIPSKRVDTKSVYTSEAFRPHSSCPNEALAQYLDLINCSLFIWLDRLEPTFNHDEGRGLLEKVSYLPGCPLVPERYRSRSVFILLVDCATKKCLMCGSTKGTLERAISCVRTHLNHRPFVCGGNADGCLTCGDKSMRARFSSSSLLKDHINGQTKKTKCTHPDCNGSFRRGGMRRHWNSMHKHTPFPVHIYTRYRSFKSLPTSTWTVSV